MERYTTQWPLRQVMREFVSSPPRYRSIRKRVRDRKLSLSSWAVCGFCTEVFEKRHFFGSSFSFNADGRMDFTRGNLKSKSASSILQALSCQFCRLQLNNPSKLVISKKWKSRIALHVHLNLGFFQMGRGLQKPAPFSLPETRPTLFGKSWGGGMNVY